MTQLTKRTTIYLEQELHKALRLKSVITDRSISEIVNELIRERLAEDKIDLRAFRDRQDEPTIDYESFLEGLKADGKI